jgi:uncharacterized protein
MKSQSPHYDNLLEYCESIPLIDCHDHTGECGPSLTDPIQALMDYYFRSDLLCASSDQELTFIEDYHKPVEERWPVFEKAWKRTCHTGYAQVVRRVMKHFYGEDKMTLEALLAMKGKLLDLSNPVIFDHILKEAKIMVRIVDSWPDVRKVLDGSLKPAPRSRLAIPLPEYHSIRNYAAVQAAVAPLGVQVTTLGEYLDACREIFTGFKKFGAVTFKDQSAYERPIDYGNPTFAQAEEVFNSFMEDPRRSAAYPDGVKPLDDFLFHAFMRMSRDLDLPVQIHTGHMAGIRNDVVKANAAGLVKVIELHQEVRFDLFHANWPYSGEILFLAKNYPNVTIDFCWANIVDPIYCQQMFCQALSSVPHAKIHAYGSDFSGYADHAWAHAQIARENVAIALATMIDMEYLSLDEAKEVAHAWLFGNANQFFRLGF